METESSNQETTMDSMVLTHLWQDQQLGQAPFTAVAIISTPSQSIQEANPSAYNMAMYECQCQANRFGVGLSSCHSCGQCLQNNVVIRDVNGKHFVVGIDCARKTNDAKLITQAEALEKTRQREIKRAREEQERQEREARIQAAHVAQRERNGGLTDYELQAKQEQEAREARTAVMEEKNFWLLSVLRQVPYTSDFVNGMIDALVNREAKTLSGRCLNILGEIYAKQISGARKNSKAYKAAEEKFLELIGDVE
jgi:hypothetical protein